MTDDECTTLAQAAQRQLIQAQRHLDTAQADIDAVRGMLQRIASEAREGEPNGR